ncbi:hypothetical protein GQX74_010353 [Glossina fuscipes]|nr:hypothetical protein GQX74_010353 [Glossina fuscipes]
MCVTAGYESQFMVNLTPERKFHKVLSSTIFKSSHDFGGSGGGGGGGGGGGSGGGAVNKITCIKAGRDNITAQVKRAPYGSVGDARTKSAGQVNTDVDGLEKILPGTFLFEFLQIIQQFLFHLNAKEVVLRFP